MGFDFTAAAKCRYCGEYLSSPGEECDHDESRVKKRAFRRLKSDELFMVESTPEHKWQKVADEKGEDWIAWFYLGERDLLSKQLENYSVEDVPHISTSLNASGVELEIAPKDLYK
jgi:hypothetical protein